MIFSVAIVGRPNVGKSTLFNRLVGKRIAIVDDRPGITRDRRVGIANLHDLEFEIIDTAGYVFSPSNRLEMAMCKQTEFALYQADFVFFVIDAKAGVIPDDESFAQFIRESGKPVILIANKADGKESALGHLEGWGLAFGEPVAVSSEHKLGFSDLHSALTDAFEQLKKSKTIEEKASTLSTLEPRQNKDKILKIAIVGQPNAGKSTLINTLIGEERLLVGPEPGITRDSISVHWNWRGQKIQLFDTAGMRKRGKVQEKSEKLSVADTLHSIYFAEIVVILLDATVPFERQDFKIINLVIQEGRGVVLAFSKWDLIEDKKKLKEELYQKTLYSLPQIAGVQTCHISAEKKYGLDELMHAILLTDTMWNKRLLTGPLNRWLRNVVLQNPPPVVAGYRSKIKYITQAQVRPPAFILSCSRPDNIPESYLRYLINHLRQSFDMKGVPIRIFLRSPENPFDKKNKKTFA